eukprot:5748315-Amphidinium_carterae.1
MYAFPRERRVRFWDFPGHALVLRQSGFHTSRIITQTLQDEIARACSTTANEVPRKVHQIDAWVFNGARLKTHGLGSAFLSRCNILDRTQCIFVSLSFHLLLPAEQCPLFLCEGIIGLVYG